MRRAPLLRMAALYCMLLQPALQAQDATVYAAVMTSGAFVVGAANSGTGLFYHRAGSDTVWTHSGPARIRANAIAVDPADAGRTTYIAAGNGLHRSTDAGVTWRTLTDWRVTEVLDIALDPRDARRLLIATAYGVFLSTDHGSTWSDSNKGRTRPFYTSAVAFDPLTPGRCYCTAEDGLYLSMNGGATWKRTSFPTARVLTLAVHSAKQGMLAAGCEDEGLYLSSDAGASWKRVTGHDTLSTVYAVAFHPTDTRVIFCGGYASGIWMSTDAGTSWALCPGTAGMSIDALAVNPSRPAQVYAGVVWAGMYRSDDAGATWKYAGLMDSQVAAITILGN